VISNFTDIKIEKLQESKIKVPNLVGAKFKFERHSVTI